MIEIKKLNKFYDNGVHALKNVDLKIEKGEFVILLGLSGSGKSTLLRSINRLIEPTSGEIIFNGANVTTAKSKELRKIIIKNGLNRFINGTRKKRKS